MVNTDTTECVRSETSMHAKNLCVRPDLRQHKKLFREMYIFVGSSSAKSFQIGQRITDQILYILLKIQEPNMYAGDFAKEAGFEGDLAEDNR